MANLNHTGAFATVEPSKINLSEWVDSINRPLLDALDKKIDQKNAEKKWRQDRIDKIKREDFELPEALKTNSLNQIVQSAMPSLIKAMNNAHNAFDQAKLNGDEEAMYKANLTIENLNNSGKLIRAQLEAYDNEAQEMHKLATGKDGGLFLTDENLQMMNAINFGEAKAIVDDNGILKFYFKDINGDGVVDEKDAVGTDGMDDLKGYLGFDPKKPFGERVFRFDLDKKVRDIGTNIDPGIVETIKGYYQIGKTRDVDGLIDENFSLNRNELAYLRQVDKNEKGESKSDEQYQKEYREKIKAYLTKDETKKHLSGKYSADSRSSSRKAKDKPRELTYIGERKDGTLDFAFKEKASGEGGIRLNRLEYNPKTDQYKLTYSERKRLAPDIEERLNNAKNQMERGNILIAAGLNPNVLDQYEEVTTTDEAGIFRVLGNELNLDSAQEIGQHLYRLSKKSGSREIKEPEGDIKKLPEYTPKSESESEEKKESLLDKTWNKVGGWFSK